MEDSSRDVVLESMLPPETVELLRAAAAERGLPVGDALGEAVRIYCSLVGESGRFEEALDWTLAHHHDILVKLGG